MILETSDHTSIHIPYVTAVPLVSFAGQQVAATGNYDACNQTLTITDPAGIEPTEE